MAEHRVVFEAMEWETPARCVRQKRVVLSDRALRLIEFQRGFVEDEWCTHEHSGYVLEGRMSVAFGDEVVEFAAGDGIDIPPGEASRHKATPLTERVLLVLFEPA
jgi:quercetin dioxygenase-like cupin family protein